VKIRLNATQFVKVANTAGHRTNVQRSDATGINQPTLSRLLNGHETASARTISAILATYPEWTFEDLFTVEVEPADEAAEHMAAAA
jgi:hypothetical protein